MVLTGCQSLVVQLSDARHGFRGGGLSAGRRAGRSMFIGQRSIKGNRVKLQAGRGLGVGFSNRNTCIKKGAWGAKEARPLNKCDTRIKAVSIECPNLFSLKVGQAWVCCRHQVQCRGYPPSQLEPQLLLGPRSSPPLHR